MSLGCGSRRELHCADIQGALVQQSSWRSALGTHVPSLLWAEWGPRSGDNRKGRAGQGQRTRVEAELRPPLPATPLGPENHAPQPSAPLPGVSTQGTSSKQAASRQARPRG